MLRIIGPRVADESENKADDRGERSRNVRGWQPSRIAMGAKRCIDVGFSAALGLVALPAMLLIALAIRLDSPGPALFRASRIGRHGRQFSMLKFRTMVADAEKRLNEVAHLNVASGMVKIPNDPRVTRVGKWLRRLSLDELPQLYNILVGHMSLIGPRPHDVGEVAAEDPEHAKRLAMRPGLTGLWQVTARADPKLETRIRWDLHYVQEWSLLLDAKILAKTVPAVLAANGGSVDHSGFLILEKDGFLSTDKLVGGPDLKGSSAAAELTG